MTWLLLALGLVLMVEGLVYAFAPHIVEDLLEMLRAMSIEARRTVGALAFVVGLALVWAAFALGLGT